MYALMHCQSTWIEVTRGLFVFRCEDVRQKKCTLLLHFDSYIWKFFWKALFQGRENPPFESAVDAHTLSALIEERLNEWKLPSFQ